MAELTRLASALGGFSPGGWTPPSSVQEDDIKRVMIAWNRSLSGAVGPGVLTGVVMRAQVPPPLVKAVVTHDLVEGADGGLNVTVNLSAFGPGLRAADVDLEVADKSLRLKLPDESLHHIALPRQVDPDSVVASYKKSTQRLVLSMTSRLQ